MGDVVQAESCPAFAARVDALWSVRPPGPGRAGPVRAGPFVITDPSHLFDLDSGAGRTATARWIRRTLAAVRTCWNVGRSDRTRFVVDRLYARLGMRSR